jgi:hypothetical protein
MNTTTNPHTIIIIAVLSMVIFCLAYLRFTVVKKEAEEWNYRVYRFSKYCTLHNHYCEDWEANILTTAQVIFVFIMFWKFRPRFFWDICPDWADIDSLIQSKSI